MEYQQSQKLKENEQILVNQRLEGLKSTSGEIVNFVVKDNDIVLFKKTLAVNDIEKEHSFIVILQEDNCSRSGNKPRYGEFILNNHQVKI